MDLLHLLHLYGLEVMEDLLLISPAQLLFQLPGVALEEAGYGSTPYSFDLRMRLP